jgi:hypothetical protein
MASNAIATGQRRSDRSLSRAGEARDLSFGGYLREMRRAPGSSPRLIAVVAFSLALVLNEGARTAGVVVGGSLALTLLVGYPLYRHLGQRRFRRP